MVQIKAKNETVRKMNLIMPEDGMVEINAEGIAEVSEKCAEIMTTCTSDWERVNSITEHNKENKNSDDNNDDEEEEGDERAQLEKKVKDANLEELKAICKEMEFDEDEYGKLSKKNLQKYILDKYDKLVEDEDEEEEDEEEDEE